MAKKDVGFLVPVILALLLAGSAADTSAFIGLEPVFMFPGDTLNVVCVDGVFDVRRGERDGNQVLGLSCHANVTPTPTVEPIPDPTATIGPTLTVVPTETPTAILTVTPEVTPTPTPPGHDPLRWHEPTTHHHGENPADHPELASMFEFVGVPDDGLRPPYIRKELHRGDVWLTVNRNEVGTLPGSTIDECLIHIHSVGHEAHSQVRTHTGGAACSAVAGGEFALFVDLDYGTAHCPYKVGFCPDEYDQAPVPLEWIDQPPYRTSTTDIVRAQGGKFDAVTGFWSSLDPNNVVKQYYPPNTNSALELVWSVIDSWQFLDDDGAAQWVCDYLEEPGCKYNASAYQVWNVHFRPPTTDRPFLGFIHPNGTLAPECSEAGEDCYLLYMSEDLPQANSFTLDRLVQQGNADKAPVTDYDTGSGITRP